jgi:hypothetical protein
MVDITAMRILIVCALLCACTVRNPNACCVSEQDCTTSGLPNGSTCEGQLVCRGNQCIAETCTVSADCESMAPYCNASYCSSECADDTQCPGASQAASDAHCVSGSCVECRDSNDCGETTPVCASGACRACEANADCASGICTADGSCAAATDIAYVAPSGGVTECSVVAPCTLTIGVTSTRKYVLLSTGTYTSSAILVLAGTKHLIGSSSGRPIITRSAAGPVVQIPVNSDVELDSVQISGATNDGSVPNGYGIACGPNIGGAQGPVTLSLSDVLLTSNASDGLLALQSTLKIQRSEFSNNGGNGITSTSSPLSCDQCRITTNHGTYGLSTQGSNYTITNSFIVRNDGLGALLGAVVAEGDFDFNTVADNVGGLRLVNAQTSAFLSHDNLVIRNGASNADFSGCAPTPCSSPGSIIADSATTIHFVSPDAQPYDYHLGASSVAVDAAMSTVTNHDFDGDVRPKGVARDVGADEAF